MQALEELLDTLRFLRGPNGCPWDRKQTMADLCRYLLDEAYELQDHADLVQPAAATDELGDVLFVTLSCVLLMEEHGYGDLDRVATGARDKIVRRHPHVFGDQTAKSPEESLQHWQSVKDDESRARGEAPAPFLGRFPRSMPALRRALAIQRKVAEVGFEWETAEQVHAKLLEEGRELREVLPLGDPARIQDELGDLLFSVVNLARFLGTDPEVALESTIAKFTARFGYVEREILAKGGSLQAATLPEMDALWEEAKRQHPPEAAGSTSPPG